MSEIKPYRLRLEYAKLDEKRGYTVIEKKNPVITWAVGIACENVGQAAYRIIVETGTESGRKLDSQSESGPETIPVSKSEHSPDTAILWDTGWVCSTAQSARYQGAEFAPGKQNRLTLRLKSDAGEESEPCGCVFCYGALPSWEYPWIGEQEAQEDRVINFVKTISVEENLESACLFVSGIGYQRILVNAETVENDKMNPAWSQYDKRCYYMVLPEMGRCLKTGENRLCIQTAAGWRSPYNVCYKLTGRIPDYVGPTLVSAALRLTYSDGREEWIKTDESWRCHYDPIVYSNIFQGETYDASEDRIQPEYPVKRVPAPCLQMTVQTLEPVREQETYRAISVSPVKSGVYVVDFGQNIAGVCRIRLPKKLKPGQTIEVKHMEFLDEDGTLYLPNLRNAECTDRYLASGDDRDLEYWQPQFTYHGFRYAQISGVNGVLTGEDIVAVSQYTDIAADSYFRCGSALADTVQRNIVQTEKSNLVSVLTDCPQRDERMGWMNDATVRFEETPWNFDIGRLFPKVVRDLLDVQDADGSITCTAPFAFGGRPADPVCSSFLIAALEAYLHTGNTEIIEEGFEGFRAWNEFLGSRSRDYIVQYSYYGDWAAPAYACVGEDGTVSSETPGIFMSTGYYYLNSVLLSRFAGILGKKEEESAYAELAEKIKKAFLAEWWNGETKQVATGSEGCQAFALWLGLIPEESGQAAADLIHDDLVKRNYQFTTGNLCTRYLLDMLAEYGYIGDAWKLITKESYPSFGFMIQQEATTIWERFELKKNSTMNSHNHPMYGAAGSWFYTHLAGIRPTGPGFSRIAVRPYLPEGLLSVQAAKETPYGDVTVRWVKRYGAVHLYVTVPAGIEAEIWNGTEMAAVTGGFHHFQWELEAEEAASVSQ